MDGWYTNVLDLFSPSHYVVAMTTNNWVCCLVLPLCPVYKIFGLCKSSRILLFRIVLRGNILRRRMASYVLIRRHQHGIPCFLMNSLIFFLRERINGVHNARDLGFHLLFEGLNLDRFVIYRCLQACTLFDVSTMNLDVRTPALAGQNVP
jgi:hypothetical protein